MKIAIAGGGTGGHLFPALAVAEELRARGHDALIFISEKEIDAVATRDRAEFKFEKLPSIGLPKPFSPAMISFAKRFLESLSACKSIYSRFRPDAVLGMGGFTSTAPLVAANRRKIPAFLHESNAIPGKANRFNARFATAVFLGFEDCAKHFPSGRVEVTGTPIAAILRTPLDRAQARAELGLDPARPTLLVTGGSQGAQGINDAMIRALPLLRGTSLQVIHLTGAAQEQVMAVNYRREEIPASVMAFCRRMDLAYSAADFALARSGAASLTEMAAFGLASILVPYPHAAENHQALNAEIFARAGAAVVISQQDIDGPRIAETLIGFLSDPGRLAAMRAAAKRLAPGNAAQRVADAIEARVASPTR